MSSDKKNLPARIDFNTSSLFAPIIDEFDYGDDIKLYDVVMNRVDPRKFERLETKSKSSVAGFAFFDGGIFENKLSIAGRGSSKDDVFTKNLSVAGSTTFKRMLAVGNRASFAGKFSVAENAFFGGLTTVAGSGSVDENVVVSGKMSIAGRLNVGEHLLADAPVAISGQLTVESLRSNNEVKLSGKVFVNQDLIARNIVLDGVKGVVSGNVVAEKIEDIYVKETYERNLSTIGGIFGYLGNTLKRILSSNSNKGILVEGDLIADDVEISNITILGDVIGKNVKIGNKTVIHGKIHYLDEIKLEDGIKEEEFEIVKGLPDKNELKTEDTETSELE